MQNMSIDTAMAKNCDYETVDGVTEHDVHYYSLRFCMMASKFESDLLKDDVVAHVQILASVSQLVERVLYSSNAPADLKRNGARECIRQIGVQILRHCSSFMHHLLVKHLQQLGSYEVRPCILGFKNDEPDGSMRQQMQFSRMKMSCIAKAVMGEIQYSSNKMTNPHNPFTKGRHERISHYTSPVHDIPMKNATLILMENAVVLLKWSEDNFYYMVVAEELQDLQSDEKESEMTSSKTKRNYSAGDCEAETVLAACCTGLKNTFGNDVKIIDVISEIPYVGKPQSESNPGASACLPVVGEMTPCGHM